jgi:HPt (histidine-containing phosphotransfer) domain-containing protein
MDDVLTKPTDLVQLQTVLAPWLAQKASPEDGVDFSVLQNIAPIPAEQIELLLEFQTQNRLDVQDLQAALRSGIHETIRRAAHRIKGASRMVGAHDLEAICADIEHRAGQQIPIEAAVLPRLATVSSNLDIAITHYAAKHLETKVA